MTGFGIIEFAGLAALPQILLGTTAIMTCLCIEFPRSLGMVDLNARDVFMGCRRFFVYCAPEVVGLATVFIVAVLLRLRGDLTVPKDELAAEIWEEIKAEWPVLMGADTLLCLQSMLRLLIFMSAAFRAGMLSIFKGSSNNTMPMLSGTDNVEGHVHLDISPLSGMGAVLLLGGMLARVWLCTQANIYRLEGPLALDGDLPFFCDLCSVPLLMALSLKALWSVNSTPMRTAAAMACAFWVASRHYLNLAKDPSIDKLFTLTHVLELFAALAFLGHAAANLGCNTQSSKRSRAFVGFVHVLMPFQQALSAYYVLTAFEPSPKLVSAGRPFCIIIWSNIFAFGAYLCAAGLYLGGLRAEGSDCSSTIASARTGATWRDNMPRVLVSSPSASVTTSKVVPSTSFVEL